MQTLHFPVSLLLQEQLVIPAGVLSLTNCKQSHTLTEAETLEHRLRVRRLTSIPTVLEGGRIKAAFNGEYSRRSPFSTLESITASDGTDAYIGDIVMCSMRLNGDDQPDVIFLARVRAFYWRTESRCIAVTVSPLVSAEDAGAELVAKAQSKPLSYAPAPSSTAVPYFECIDSSNERRMRACRVLSVSLSEALPEPAPAAPVVKAATVPPVAAAALPVIVGQVRLISGSLKGRKQSPRWELVHEARRYMYFDMHAADNNLNETGLPVVKCSLDLLTDHFLVYGKSTAQKSVSALY